MKTSASNPTSISDCTDNSRANAALQEEFNRLPLSPTLPALKSECNDQKPTQGTVRFPVEYSTLPHDGQDLLMRLLEFRPERRIRSMFSLQRIAFFMGFNFDDVKKKKVLFFFA